MKSSGEDLNWMDGCVCGFLIGIGLTEAAHLAGCLFGWSFLTVTNVLAGEILIGVLAAIAALAFRRVRGGCQKSKNSFDRADCMPLYACFFLIVLLQLLSIIKGSRIYLEGDMTLETVNTFLSDNRIYAVNPLTGQEYTLGMPLRLRILCLPTLYGALCRWLGLSAAQVVLVLVPVVVLLLSYLSYASLAGILFPGERIRQGLFLLIVAILYSAGTYLFGMDGFDVLYSGFRGVTIRSAILVPYLISALLRRRYLPVLLCILAEACIVWTLYGAGVCVLVTLGMLCLEYILNRRRRRPSGKEAAL